MLVGIIDYNRINKVVENLIILGNIVLQIVELKKKIGLRIYNYWKLFLLIDY